MKKLSYILILFFTTQSTLILGQVQFEAELSKNRLGINERLRVSFKMNKNEETEIEAAVFRKMIKHFQEHSEVQNIDVMNVAGFCRNCLSNWYEESSSEIGREISNEEARERVYGMPYSEWKEKYQI